MKTYSVTTLDGRTYPNRDAGEVARMLLNAWVGCDWRLERNHAGHWHLVIGTVVSAPTEEAAVQAFAAKLKENDPTFGNGFIVQPEPESEVTP